MSCSSGMRRLRPSGKPILTQRLASLPVTDKKGMPTGPLNALFDLHLNAVDVFRALLDDPDKNWDAPMTLEIPSLPAQSRTVSRRKIGLHALFHSQRHWAQLATLLRTAGYPTEFKGDFLFSLALM
jgi:hypothetical protein